MPSTRSRGRARSRPRAIGSSRPPPPSRLSSTPPASTRRASLAHRRSRSKWCSCSARRASR
eukprot:238204-Prymnesium_polylepis.1